uniref:C-type lectin domain-containing protein n=1 Tax=Sinocyclocheilus rhinocerous TaxID=307959 RepID=A0A673KUH9_9TELE
MFGVDHSGSRAHLCSSAVQSNHQQLTGHLWGPDEFYISDEEKSWSDSRQYCRDRGADLVIINTEEKQRFISSFIKQSVWIGLSDTENEGVLKWLKHFLSIYLSISSVMVYVLVQN